MLVINKVESPLGVTEYENAIRQFATTGWEWAKVSSDDPEATVDLLKMDVALSNVSGEPGIHDIKVVDHENAVYLTRTDLALSS